MTTVPGLPTHIGSAEFSEFGVWEPGSKRWLVKRRRMGPLVRNLKRAPIRSFVMLG